jgi:hypothetical protein
MRFRLRTQAAYPKSLVGLDAVLPDDPGLAFLLDLLELHERLGRGREELHADLGRELGRHFRRAQCHLLAIMLGIARERGNPRCFRAAIFVILRNSIQVLRRVLDQVFVTQQIGITRFDNWLLGEYRPPLWSFATFTQSLPIAFAATDEGPRWMAMTWSLAMEEQFYLLFPLAVYFLPRRGTTLR